MRHLLNPLDLSVEELTNILDLAADIDIKVVSVPVAGVPVTMVSLADFHAGVQDLSAEKQNASFMNTIAAATFYGQTDVNFFKLNQMLPGLDTFCGDLLDITVLQLDDTTLSFCIKNYNISVDSTAKLFETAELGKIEADLGGYNYTNYLLGINQNVAGVHLKTSNEYGLQFGNWFRMNTDGMSQIDINNKFAGVMINGGINYNYKIFRRHAGDMEGTGLIGLNIGAEQFTILLKGDNYMKDKDAGFRINFTRGNLLPELQCY